MNSDDIVASALAQADAYLKHCRTHKLGRVHTALKSARSLGGGLFVYETEQKLFDADQITLYDPVQGVRYHAGKEIEVEESDEQTNRLVVRLNDATLDPAPFSSTTLLVESDITFLIENLIESLQRLEAPLSLDKPAPNIAVPTVSLPTLALSDEQRAALELIARSGLSYIWGPPGTGKTQVVLAVAIAMMLDVGKRVLLLTPTNRSLEQAIEGLIVHYRAKKRPLTGILRLGVASSDFARRYPMLCESAQIKNETKNLEAAITTLELKLDGIENSQTRESSLFDLLQNEEAIREELAALRKSVKHIRNNASKTRLKTATLVAMTLDHYIGRSLREEIAVDHIFLDEAGYASLMKALPLFGLKVPITLLGDHMQLPPVHQQVESEEDFFLWRPSVLYAETLLSTPVTELRGALAAQQPRLQTIRTSRLTLTHRFGPNLTAILDHFVYRTGFASARDEALELYFVDSRSYAKVATERKREAPDDAEAIAALLAAGKIDRQTAILTPYNAQVGILKKRLGRGWYEKISTIHKSQGQEWESVVLSIVDNCAVRGHPRGIYFTDTHNHRAQGLNLINTVVSRAKKRLFLVGDRTFWLSRPDQLLGALAEAAKPLNLLGR